MVSRQCEKSRPGPNSQRVRVTVILSSFSRGNGAGKGRIDFLTDPLWSIKIARREMQGHHALDACAACQRSRLRRGQVQLACGHGGIFVKERGFDEELVGAAGELDDACGVVRVIDGVDHIDDPLARHDVQDVGLELAQ